MIISNSRQSQLQAEYAQTRAAYPEGIPLATFFRPLVDTCADYAPHPEAAASNQAVRAFAEQVGIWLPEKGADYVTMNAYWHPHAVTRSRLDASGKLYALMFYIDDMVSPNTDTYYVTRQNKARLTEFTAVVADIMRGVPVEDRDNPLIKATQAILGDFLAHRADSLWLERLKHITASHLRQTITDKASSVTGGLSVPAYAQARYHDSGMHISILAAEFTSDCYMPYLEMRAQTPHLLEKLEALRDLATMIGGLVNDFFSFHKEFIEASHDFNLISVYWMNYPHLRLIEAIEGAADFTLAYFEDYQTLAAQLEREARGTDIIIYLKEDAKEFLQTWTLKNIIRKHSDYIAFPIHINDEADATNKQTALWRQPTSEVTPEQYDDFYKMLTLDFERPLHHIHMIADVPLQFYALLYFPSSREPNMFSLRKEPGLKLYARKVLIQEYSKDLLPEYLNFVQGVVDSEDIPLNVSRESVQANRVMATLKKTLTNKVLGELKRMMRNDREQYLKVYQGFGRFLKQGIVTTPADRTEIEPLLLFNTTRDDDPATFSSLDEVVERLAANQNDLYYIIGDDFHSARRSPHLDAFRQRGIEVLYFTDPVDAALVMSLIEFKGHTLHSVDEADLDLTDIGMLNEADQPKQEALAEGDFESLRARFAEVLGERVREVRPSKTLTGSPARLVSDEAGSSRQMFRINRLLDREYELPVKILELNPRHTLIHNLNHLLAAGDQDALVTAVVEQVFETALLQDGIHPDPAAMADRLTMLMEAATTR
ncbi:MAG: molecular chaperone HtpG [Anaerolineae bacterium]|nr:molecular chaperone HtpG [Anaerolineae bacterium]